MCVQCLSARSVSTCLARGSTRGTAPALIVPLHRSATSGKTPVRGDSADPFGRAGCVTPEDNCTSCVTSSPAVTAIRGLEELHSVRYIAHRQAKEETVKGWGGVGRGQGKRGCGKREWPMKTHKRRGWLRRSHIAGQRARGEKCLSDATEKSMEAMVLQHNDT